jgi:hypothetical protein
MRFVRWLANIANTLSKIFGSFVETAFGQIVLFLWPVMINAYFLCLDVHGDDWPILKNNKTFHDILFISLLLVSFIVGILIALRNTLSINRERMFMEMIGCFGSSVKTKCDRFRRKFPNISPNCNVFKIITEPIEQIENSSQFYCKLIENIFGLPQDSVDITVIHMDEAGHHYEFQAQKNTKHMDLSLLMNEKSAAAQCLSSGVEMLVACKNEAANNGEYLLSDTDKRSLPGSAYCYPVVLGKPFGTSYIITITTFGKRFCGPRNENGKEAAKIVLKEIAKRIELELILQAMKEYAIVEAKQPQPRKRGQK